MHPVLKKTFGGLTARYYIRNFLFGLIFPALFLTAALNSPQPLPVGSLILVIVNSLLYPYSRFVYESVVGYIIGDNLFVLNAIVMLIAKFITMAFCWAFAIFMAPVGLAYLYWHHTRTAN